MAQLSRIEYFLPDDILNNADLEFCFPEWKSDQIFEKIGVKERHIVSENQTALDLAEKAAEKVLINFDKEKIDFLILCTQSPDYFLPTSACILQNKLGLRKDTGALDFNLGCSGFIYGLAIAKGLIHSRIASNILLIMSETYSKHIHPADKSNRSIFGDAAAACLVSGSEINKIMEFELGTDGSGMNNLIVQNGGMRNRKKEDGSNIITPDNIGNYLFMNGPEIFNFTIQNIPGLVERTLKKNNLTIDSIDYVIFHQANKFMLDYLCKKIKFPAEKFHQNMEYTGNTVSASIPIALKDCIENKKTKMGDKVLLCGFGVGYSYGATIIKI